MTQSYVSCPERAWTSDDTAVTLAKAMAFAALGAANVLSADPDHAIARSLLTDAADAMTVLGDCRGWPWPEPRLTYANRSSLKR